MPSQICVDACLVVKLVLPEADSPKAQSLWTRWIGEEVDLIAPPLLIFEGVSAIRLNVTRKQITVDVADIAFTRFLGTLKNIRFLTLPDIDERAWRLAKQFNQSQVYDAYYCIYSAALSLRAIFPGTCVPARASVRSNLRASRVLWTLRGFGQTAPSQ